MTTTTIQKTSKKWKVLKLIGGIGLVASGITAMIVGATGGTPTTSITIICISLGLILTAKIGKWWSND